MYHGRRSSAGTTEANAPVTIEGTMTGNRSVSRRTYLAALSATGAGVIAGCLENGGSATALSRGDLSPAEESSIPSNGDELPDVDVPSPLHDGTVSTREYVGERHALVTFVFTRCTTVCPVLTAALAQVQAEAFEGDFADEIVLFPITFDPEHDREEQIRTFSEANGADPEHESWQFLRPDGPDRAHEVVTDTFGIGFRENEDPDGMAFTHTSAIVLSNKDGVVERTYAGQVPELATVIDDTEAVVDHFA